MTEPVVVALVPAYNEEQTIKETVAGLSEIPFLSRIIVVDDGSTDKTAESAADAGAQVIKLEKNHGKGAAIRETLGGIDCEILLIIDGDIGSSSVSAASLVEPVIKNEADMTVGILPPSKKTGGFGLARKLAHWSIKLKTGGEMAAPLSGQRAIKKSVLKSSFIKNGYGFEVGLTISFLNSGLKVKEVPVNMQHVGTGKDLAGFRHRGKQFVEIFKSAWL